MSIQWFEEHRVFSLMIFLLIIWFTLLTFFYLKADEVTKDPCSICAAKMGDKVSCTIQGYIPITREYYGNGTIKTFEGITLP